MPAATIDPIDGLLQISARTVTTVQQVILPKWTREVSISVVTGAVVEVSWTGTLDAALLTAGLWVTCLVGAPLNQVRVPKSKFQSGDVLSLWIRDQAATATTIEFVCVP